MKKLFLFLPFVLFGIDFSNCYKKFYKTDSFQITPSVAVTFSKPSKYFSYDKFTGLFFYKHKGKPLKFLNHFYLGWEMASIKRNGIYVSNFAKRGFIKDYLAGKSVENSIISDKFCRAVGVGGNGFFLDKKIILHFLKNGYYGAIPITFDENFRVIDIDPFAVKGVKRGDKLLKINGKEANILNFRKFIVFGKLGDKVKITFKKRSLWVKIVKKELFKNYLRYYGIFTDENLVVKQLPKWIYKKYYISSGSKIVEINGKKVSNLEEANEFLNGKNDTITFNDNGIFIKVKMNGRVY